MLSVRHARFPRSAPSILSLTSLNTGVGLVVGGSGERAITGDIQQGQHLLRGSLTDGPGSNIGWETEAGRPIVRDHSASVEGAPDSMLPGWGSSTSVPEGSQPLGGLPLDGGLVGLAIPRIDPDAGSGSDSDSLPADGGQAGVDTVDIAERLDGDGTVSGGDGSWLAARALPSLVAEMAQVGDPVDAQPAAANSQQARAAAATTANVLGRHRPFELAVGNRPRASQTAGPSRWSQDSGETRRQVDRVETSPPPTGMPTAAGHADRERPLGDAAWLSPRLFHSPLLNRVRSFPGVVDVAPGEPEYSSPLADALVFVIGGFGTLLLTRQAAWSEDDRPFRLRN